MVLLGFRLMKVEHELSECTPDFSLHIPELVVKAPQLWPFLQFLELK